MSNRSQPKYRPSPARSGFRTEEDKDNPWTQVQEPEVKPYDGARGGHEFNHPAYGTISASRISGQTNLFGSHVGHTGFMQVRIGSAKMQRSGYDETIHGGIHRYIEVNLSYAQWVSFVSSISVGSGTPCTIRMLSDGKTITPIPGLPDVEKAADRMQSRIDELLTEQIAGVDRQKEIIKELCSTLPAKKRDAILSALGQATQHLEANHKYAHTILTEQKEKLVTEARGEIEATLESAVRGIGLKSIDQLSRLMELAGDPEQVEQMLLQAPTAE